MSWYKDTPEAQAVREKYGDILFRERPEPSHKHPRMALGNRAKIFSPFAALRGFDEELSEECSRTRRVSQAGISEEDRMALSAQLKQLGRGMRVTVRYFSPDCPDPEEMPVGRYKSAAGRVQAVDLVRRVLCLELESRHRGPGVEKKVRLEIPFDEIETLEWKGP